ncbi:MAG: hypothetical protein BGO38_09360 [Cellulomonas sp. 73-145]|nr:MAG: hypothetical protein BGO38_09360 [Cellulomonas sp. 73-145]
MVVAGVLVVVGTSFAAWEAWWPTNVDARALDAFGPPIAGAVRTGPDWVSSGNIACLDSCSVLTRSFTVPPASTVGQVLSEAETTAHRAGYTIPFGITCMVTVPAESQFMCSVGGQTSASSLEIEVYGVDPTVVTPRSLAGYGLPPMPNDTVTGVRVGISER